MCLHLTDKQHEQLQKMPFKSWMTNAEWEFWCKNHRPPQEWYDDDDLPYNLPEESQMMLTNDEMQTMCAKSKDRKGWKKGPMPTNTYFWGGVKLVEDKDSDGFYFADFCGDHVKVWMGDGEPKVRAWHEVAWYNNCLELPPKE